MMFLIVLVQNGHYDEAYITAIKEQLKKIAVNKLAGVLWREWYLAW